MAYIVQFQINLSGGKNTDLALALSGTFDQLLGFGSNAPVAVHNFAVWIPSRNNWLQNLNVATISVDGAAHRRGGRARRYSTLRWIGGVV